MAGEFEEIAHSGGKVTIHIIDDEIGRRGYQMSYRSMRPVPMALTGVYALGQSGMPVATYNIAGPDRAPFRGCLPVMVASDSEGKFGHHCSACDGYWRSGPWANVCPYCAVQAQPYEFLSHAQLRYVRHYCEVFAEAINADEPGEVTIDMDVVADAVQSTARSPRSMSLKRASNTNSSAQLAMSSMTFLGASGSAHFAARATTSWSSRTVSYRPYAIG
jgi:hypothetical protein